MPSTYNQRVAWLRTQGLMEFEAHELADSYRIAQMRTLPYLRDFRRQRLSYISRLRNLGYTDRRINNAILRVYKRNGWTTVFDMVRHFRKLSIDRQEYTPLKKKGSHHPKGSGWSSGNRQTQRQRRTYKKRQEALDENERLIIKAIVDNNQAERRRLEQERNKLQGNP